MNIVIIIVAITGVIIFTLKLVNIFAENRFLNQFALFQNRITNRQLAIYYCIMILLFLQILSRHL